MKMIPAFYFDPQRLKQLADKHKKSFHNAKPYGHVVIDNFLPLKIANLVCREYPKLKDIPWTLHGPGDGAKLLTPRERNKMSCSEERFFPPFTRHLMMTFNSSTFLEFLENLTGIQNLVPDASFGGCGLHSTGRGGKLMVHTDLSRHSNPKCDQMLNLIFFINQKWKEEYGGHLELWSRDGKRCVQKIAPMFNRLVIFNTGTNTFHGHPHPLGCPEFMRRNSLSVYYYVIGRKKDRNYRPRQSHRVTWKLTQKDEFEHMKDLFLTGKLSFKKPARAFN